MRKLILLEINEIPHRVYEYYIEKAPNSTLAQIIKDSTQYTTVSTDTGELHPWSTWPTLHRGVDNTVHHIKDIGEELEKTNIQFPPIWEILKSNGIKTGVFSSLHTYPLPDHFKDFDFLVPDPFANGSDTHPKYIVPFQAFNLAMTKKSGRSVDKGIDKKAATALFMALPKLGIRPKTLWATGRQLIEEKTQPWKTVRRRTFQSILAFDIFLRLLKKKKPSFVTFFSNHVASSLHRYWAATFPDDYESFNLSDDWRKTYENEIFYSMERLNQMVSEIYRFIKKNPEYKLIIASSMGQAATKAMEVNNELFMASPEKFVSALGSFNFKPLSAMHPQYNLSIAPDQSEAFSKKLKQLKINDKPLSYRKKNEEFFSIDLGYPNIEDFNIRLDNQSLSLEDLGLEIKKIDDQSGGTAYHIPQGAFFIYDIKNPNKSTERKDIDLREVAPAILDFYQINRNDYMMKPGITI